jgi:hypothetical protein
MGVERGARIFLFDLAKRAAFPYKPAAIDTGMAALPNLGHCRARRMS